MTKNDSYDQISPCDDTASFSEVASKLGRGCAAAYLCAIRLRVVFSLNKYRRRTVLPTEFVAIA
jgi:hypothetical protein